MSKSSPGNFFGGNLSEPSELECQREQHLSSWASAISAGSCVLRGSGIQSIRRSSCWCSVLPVSSKAGGVCSNRIGGKIVKSLVRR
eukprot:2245267-Rhodomonas_salina.1